LFVQLVSKISNLCDHNPPTLQTDRQTTCNRNTALCTIVHRAVKTLSRIIYYYVIYRFVVKRLRPLFVGGAIQIAFD